MEDRITSPFEVPTAITLLQGCTAIQDALVGFTAYTLVVIPFDHDPCFTHLHVLRSNEISEPERDAMISFL